MAIYSDQHLPLKELLASANNDEGATLLIPDLQRPYVWKPIPIIRLIDSLVRGWPFGTLLTWSVTAGDPARELARAFWKVVDRTGDREGEVISKKHPPAGFRMVLDGQQRVQSLLLAFGGDAWGLKQYDRDWNTDLNEIKNRGPQGQAHWSLGCLCVNLRALTEEFARTKRLVAVDFLKVLEWVVTDPATCQSSLEKKPNYIEVLRRTTDPESIGNFVRLSRLWRKAPEQEGMELEEADALAAELLTENNINDLKLQRPVGSLLTALGRVKRTRVTFLELSDYKSSHGTRDEYNDAVVNIFTRLNSAGRVLSQEDITFAWLKVGWKVEDTAGKSASRCFEELRESLEELSLPMTSEDLVAAVSFVWAVGFKNGKLLSSKDLLQGDRIRPMATELSANWSLMNKAMTDVCEHVRDRRLYSGEHYQSQTSIVFLCAWYFVALLWRKHHQLGELDKDAFDKRLAESLDGYADRWLICSQWAGVWASGSGDAIAALAIRLAARADEVIQKDDLAVVTESLAEHLSSEVKMLESAANSGLATLKATDRRQVRSYYTALWIWNRLDKNRWMHARLALREKGRKRVSLDVDHVVAWALWQKKIALSDDVSLETVGLGAQRANIEEQVNELGNCLLLEKNFNISKSDKPLKDFLDQVYEFRGAPEKIAEWATALDLDMAQVDSANTDAETLLQVFAVRTEKIRNDLMEFVRGTKARVDLDEGMTPLEVDASPKMGRHKRQLEQDKLRVMKLAKERLKRSPESSYTKVNGAKGGFYWFPFSVDGEAELRFGVDWERPYLNVPKDGNYDTSALAGENWNYDINENIRWYAFGETNLADLAASEHLVNELITVVRTVRSSLRRPA